MNITAKYTSLGAILATIDGVEMTIPADPANRHYAELIAQGVVIEPYMPPAASNADVNAERDRRLYTVFTFQGKEYDCDHVSLARITGAATLAGFAIGAGAPVGYARWHGGDTDFMWIAHDNSLTTMDAQTAFAFGQAAAENQSAHVFAADILKRQNPIPADYTDDRHWP